MWLINSTLTYTPKITEHKGLNKILYKNVYRSTIHYSQQPKDGNNPKFPSNEEWINKFGIPVQWNIIWSIRRNEVLIYATTRINLQDVMLSQRCQTRKTTCCLIPFLWNTQNRQLARDTKQISVCQSLRIGGMESDCLMGEGFLLGGWKCSEAN